MAASFLIIMRHVPVTEKGFSPPQATAFQGVW
jgi:hypothetical protein